MYSVLQKREPFTGSWTDKAIEHFLDLGEDSCDAIRSEISFGRLFKLETLSHSRKHIIYMI